jgi:hypothetical protein
MSKDRRLHTILACDFGYQQEIKQTGSEVLTAVSTKMAVSGCIALHQTRRRHNPDDSYLRTINARNAADRSQPQLELLNNNIYFGPSPLSGLTPVPSS